MNETSSSDSLANDIPSADTPASDISLQPEATPAENFAQELDEHAPAIADALPEVTPLAENRAQMKFTPAVVEAQPSAVLPALTSSQPVAPAVKATKPVTKSQPAVKRITPKVERLEFRLDWRQRWQNWSREFSPHLALLLLPIVVILLLNEKPWYRLPQVNAQSLQGEAGVLAEPTAEVVLPGANINNNSPAVVIVRTVEPHTNIPQKVRRDPSEYEVQVGDSLYGIAEKFGVSAESIFWSNSATLQNDPHALAPGQKLIIPPVDGVLHRVQDKDTLAGIAKYLGNIDLETIIFWPGNDIDPDDPQIKVGQLVMVPGGSKPTSIPQPSAGTKTNAVTGRTYTTGFWSRAGAGACANEGNYSGQPGSSTFIWPANRHVLSGYDYTNIHQGIDVAAGLGEPIFASDTGVVVFSGWSDWGYGNMIVLDHGNGFQTLYAHLSSWNVGCGQQVGQGSVIGGSGSTGRSSGPHLHFEILANGGRTNPWFYLPPP